MLRLKNDCKEQKKNSFYIFLCVVGHVVPVLIFFHSLLFGRTAGVPLRGAGAERQLHQRLRRWLMTAGRCVLGANMMTKVVAGDEFYRGSDDARKVEILNDKMEIITPERFDEDEYKYNIAIP